MMYTPKETATKGVITITWDMLIITDKKIKCNKPNIFMVQEKEYF